MKANKALKRLAKIETLISSVTKRLSAGAPHVRKALDDLKAAFGHAKEAVSAQLSSATPKKKAAAKPGPKGKKGGAAGKKTAGKKAAKKSAKSAGTKAPVAKARKKSAASKRSAPKAAAAAAQPAANATQTSGAGAAEMDD